MNYFTQGNKSILDKQKFAFFCSQKCPGNIIIKSYDLATNLRDKSICVISGFHTPIEQDVLNYLLKGNQPIIICPAKSISNMRIPKEQKNAYKNNRILYISPFTENKNRVSSILSVKRNQFVVDIADHIFIAYAHPQSKTEQLAQYAIDSKKPVYTFDVPETQNLISLGAQPLIDFTNLQ